LKKNVVKFKLKMGECFTFNGIKIILKLNIKNEWDYLYMLYPETVNLNSSNKIYEYLFIRYLEIVDYIFWINSRIYFIYFQKLKLWFPKFGNIKSFTYWIILTAQI